MAQIPGDDKQKPKSEDLLRNGDERNPECETALIPEEPSRQAKPARGNVGQCEKKPSNNEHNGHESLNWELHEGRHCK